MSESLKNAMGALRLSPRQKVSRGYTTTSKQHRKCRDCTTCARNASSQVGTREERKARIRELAGEVDRGVLKSNARVRDEILAQVEALEEVNPEWAPMRRLEVLEGKWRLVYTTKQVGGRAKTKLGLRGLVSLGEMEQVINPLNSTAVTVVQFRAPWVDGALSMRSTFQAGSDTRADVEFETYALEPDSLREALERYEGVLLSAFSPEGWLETTYVDDSMRIGRDNDGYVHVLERTQ